jgi:hypothetical protein
MTGNAEADIEISYIPQALNEITAYIREAANTSAPGKERKLYRLAAKASCTALIRLVGHDQLWDRLADDYQRRIASWEDLEVPVLARLLDGLGYSGATPATDVITDANQQLRQAAGISVGRDPVTPAREAVGWLHDEICAGKEAAYRTHRRDRLVVVRNTFVGIFMAVVVLPELQDHIRSLNLDPEVVRLARELVERAGAALSNVSLGLIAIPRAVASMPGFIPRTTAAESMRQTLSQPPGRTAMPSPGGQGPSQPPSLADTLLGRPEGPSSIMPPPPIPPPDPPAQGPKEGPGGRPRGPAGRH